MISIIDYGVGNLASVQKAFHFIGSEAVITNDRDLILDSDGVVLPGVGAYLDAMESLKKAGMVDLVKKMIEDGKPFLGICLGMQLLFEYSEEGGDRVPGLGVFKGSIRQFPLNMNLKVPHMGWNLLKTRNDCPVFRGLDSDPYVYFVHSYFLNAADKDIVAAVSNYGIDFDAAVYCKNVFATQFHPEKSGKVGLAILKNWVDLFILNRRV